MVELEARLLALAVMALILEIAFGVMLYVITKDPISLVYYLAGQIVSSIFITHSYFQNKVRYQLLAGWKGELNAIFQWDRDKNSGAIVKSSSAGAKAGVGGGFSVFVVLGAWLGIDPWNLFGFFIGLAPGLMVAQFSIISYLYLNRA